MKIFVDPERCQGHARCYAVAPELFGLDDLGHAFPAAEGVHPDLVDKAIEAAANCPERAILIRTTD